MKWLDKMDSWFQRTITRFNEHQQRPLCRHYGCYASFECPDNALVCMHCGAAGEDFIFIDRSV